MQAVACFTRLPLPSHGCQQIPEIHASSSTQRTSDRALGHLSVNDLRFAAAPIGARKNNAATTPRPAALAQTIESAVDRPRLPTTKPSLTSPAMNGPSHRSSKLMTTGNRRSTTSRSGAGSTEGWLVNAATAVVAPTREVGASKPQAIAVEVACGTAHSMSHIYPRRSSRKVRNLLRDESHVIHASACRRRTHAELAPTRSLFSLADFPQACRNDMACKHFAMNRQCLVQIVDGLQPIIGLQHAGKCSAIFQRCSARMLAGVVGLLCPAATQRLPVPAVA
jgi:hypothetical protein